MEMFANTMGVITLVAKVGGYVFLTYLTYELGRVSINKIQEKKRNKTQK